MFPPQVRRLAPSVSASFGGGGTLHHTSKYVCFDRTREEIGIASDDLRRRDIHGALSVLAEADATDPTRPFAPELVARLASLVGADRDAAYYEFNFQTHALRHVAEHQAADIPDDIDTAFSELCAFYPLREKSVGNASQALTLGDFASPEAQRRNPVVQEILRPLGIVHELKVFLPAPAGSSRTFSFTRSSGRDFDRRDKAVLELLRPHLARLRERWGRTFEPVCLTTREQEIVRLLGTGMKNQEIADQLVLSPGTIRKHLDNIYVKLGVHSRTGAVAAARQAAAAHLDRLAAHIWPLVISNSLSGAVMYFAS